MLQIPGVIVFDSRPEKEEEDGASVKSSESDVGSDGTESVGDSIFSRDMSVDMDSPVESPISGSFEDISIDIIFPLADKGLSSDSVKEEDVDIWRNHRLQRSVHGRVSKPLATPMSGLSWEGRRHGPLGTKKSGRALTIEGEVIAMALGCHVSFPAFSSLELFSANTPSISIAQFGSLFFNGVRCHVGAGVQVCRWPQAGDLNLFFCTRVARQALLTTSSFLF